MMKNILNIVVLLLVSTATLFGQKDSEIIKKSLKVQDNNSEFWFCLCNVNGMVEVEAYNGSTIELELDKQIFGRDADDVKLGMEEMQIDVSQDREYVKVIMLSPDQRIDERDDPLDCGWNWRRNNRNEPDYWYRFDYKIKVPDGISVKVSTVNKGDVFVKNVGGHIYAGNVNGDITLEGVKGNTKANTVNGIIEVVYDQVPSEFGNFKTVNGNIVVSVPERANASYNFETQWGEVYSEVEFDGRLSPKVVSSASKNGGTKYKISNSNGYQVGKGGPSLEFKTLNGDIRIRKKK